MSSPPLRVFLNSEEERMFDDEYELAIAVMTGVESRYKQDGYEVKRYHFHSE
jgi:hypothetical protein